MQLRKRKPVDYSDHELFSKFLSETEESDSSDSTNYSMGNVVAQGKRKAESESMSEGFPSEGDAETGPRSWGSFHVRSVLGGRRGQISSQDGVRFVENGRLAGMNTLERVDALVRGAGFGNLAMPSTRNTDSETSWGYTNRISQPMSYQLGNGLFDYSPLFTAVSRSDSDGIIRVSLPSLQEGTRKRKLEESQSIRGWECSSKTLSFREAYSCETSDYIRDYIGTRAVPPRCVPAVSSKETSSSDEGCDLSSYHFHHNAKGKPANTSLDRLLEELSTVNVANKLGHGEDSARATNESDIFNMCDGVIVEETPQKTLFDEEAPLPDLNNLFSPREEGDHEMFEGSPSPLKRLRRLHQVCNSTEDGRTSAGLLDYQHSVDFEHIIDGRKQKVHGKTVVSEYDWEYTPQDASPAYVHEEDLNQDEQVSEEVYRPFLVRRVGRVEKILSVKDRDPGPDAIFRVKESQKSYRQAVSVQGSVLQKHCPQLLRMFLRRMDKLGRRDGHTMEDKNCPDFDPMYTRIDRIIAAEQRGCKKFYLVKWCGLPYSEVTWEKEENLRRDITAICRYHKNNLRISAIRQVGTSLQGVFRDGRRLRDYQEAGLAWLDHNYKNRTNCILADEMGLGKTIQSVAMLENLRIKQRIRGPFLVVAPVSTLGHWQREIESLTDMNCVVYTGNQEDRHIIRNHEFYYADGNSCELKFNVLLTSFEILMKDQNKLAKETWQYIIVDEAHRLKSRESKTAQSLRQLRVRHGGLLLLTGTPVQNNTREIFSLLNLLDQDEFESEEEFLRKYGDIKAAEQIKDLQDKILRPRLLRRMKEHVEKSIPLKEETIVWVELTREQRAFYRAIYANNISSLLKGSTIKNMPNLRNVAMELRKLCNHPFLCDGLEENIRSKHRSMNDGSTSNLAEKLLSQSSGKMVLVDKLLPKLKEAGRRVLIFSQFTMMLDLLEDYLLAKGYSFERIDGKIRGSERQAAIDRYSAKDSNIFVFLLSTRAGGLGITLTAADTCIIYDSDWNPQNDLQAMARCHRIGQTKDVKIYRLITRNTYEQRLFECSSRKYGLDEAILGNRMGIDVSHDHNKNIESLLKHGAYDMLKDDGEAASEFSSQNIDQILEQRTQQRLIGGRANNTFSVATFISNTEIISQDSSHEVELGSSSSWQEILPEACEKAVMEAMASREPALPLCVRKRTRSGVDYKDMDVSVENSSDEIDVLRKIRKRTRARVARGETIYEEGSEGYDTDVKQWSDQDLKRLEDHLFALGRGRTEQVMTEARLNHYSLQEVDEVSEALIQLCRYLQVSSEAGACQSPPSVTSEVNTSGNATFTNPRSELKQLQRSKNLTLLSARNDKKLMNSDLGTKIETRSKRSGMRVLTKESRLIVNGEAQPSGENLQMNIAEERSKGAHLEPPVVPAVVLRAMQSLEFQERLQKEASRYLQSLEDHEILAEALQLQSEDFPPRVAFRSKKLPDWWGKKEDADLLKAAHLYGHKFFKKMKSDTTLSFVSRVNAPVSAKKFNTKSRAKDIVIKKRAELPSDSVLCSRLKKLIQALREGANKPGREIVAFRHTPYRKAGDQQGSELAPRKPVVGSSCVARGPPSSSKQLSMTKILTASLAIEAEKKKVEGKNVLSTSVPTYQAAVLPGIVDGNLAMKAKAQSPYLSEVLKESRIFFLKTKQMARQKGHRLKSPKQDEPVFKVPNEKQKDCEQSPKQKQQDNEKDTERGSSSRKQRNVSSIFKSRPQH